MKLLTKAASGLAAIFALSSVAHAQGVLTERNVSLGLAKEIADVAMDTCQKNGYNVSVTVVNRAGLVVLQHRGDNASPHTVENSQRKAYTSRTFRRPSGEWAAQVGASTATSGPMFLTGVIALAGALPIKVGDDVIGAVGVSGSPGGDKDEVCAKAALDKVAGQLK